MMALAVSVRPPPPSTGNLLVMTAIRYGALLTLSLCQGLPYYLSTTSADDRTHICHLILNLSSGSRPLKLA